MKRCGLIVGRDYAVCPGRGKDAIGRVIVTDVRLEYLGHLTEAEARREGFPTIKAFMDAWRKINKDRLANGWDAAWRVEFEVMR